MASNPIVQYVVVRGDLISKLKWPTGAVIAQACHACSAVVHLYYKDNLTQEYLRDLDSMHKIVLEGHCEEVEYDHGQRWFTDLARAVSYESLTAISSAANACLRSKQVSMPSPFEATNEESLQKLSELLTTENIGHKLWIEQPENFLTCIAVKPYRKNEVQKYFKQFKLLK